MTHNQIKQSTKDGKTTLRSQINKDCIMVVRYGLASSHVNDKWTIERAVLMPSLINNDWDHFWGEQSCISGTEKIVNAHAAKWLKLMIKNTQIPTIKEN